MSFEEVTMFRIVCDYEERDGDGSPIAAPYGASPGDDGEYYAWARTEDAQDEISESDEWTTTEDGRHFCSDHAQRPANDLSDMDANDITF